MNMKRLLLTAVIFVAASSAVLAQMPGMDVSEGSSNNKPAQTVKAVSPVDDGLGPVGRFWARYMGSESPYRGLILVILTLAVLINLKAYLTRTMRRKLKEQAFLQENADNFLKVWNASWKFVIAILVLMAMSGSLKLLGLTAGFFGMMLGWSLQQPVTGIAAWLMIIVKKPFKIGDRVVIAGVTGDVTGISLTHVILNQVGGSVGGEERSGRGILVPNAILFQHMIINYTLEQEYMLDEVPVRLTFDSDWELAKRILIDAAKDATADIIKKTGQEPFIRCEFLDWGIMVRLRYNTVPAQRQELSTNIIEILLREFGKEFPKVRFAIPSQNIRHRPDTGVSGSEGISEGQDSPAAL